MRPYTDCDKEKLNIQSNKMIFMRFSFLVSCCLLFVVSGVVAQPEQAEQPEVMQVEARSPVHALGFSPNGNYLAVGIGHQRKDDLSPLRFEIWEVASGKRLHSLTHQFEQYGQVFFSSDSTRLIGVGLRAVPAMEFETQATAWEVATGKQLYNLEMAPTNSLGPLSFSPDGSRIAGTVFESKVRESRICVWDAATGKLLQHFNDLPGFVTPLTYSKDGQSLIFSFWELNQIPRIASLCVMDARTGHVTRTLTRGNSYAYRLILSPDGDTLAAPYYAMGGGMGSLAQLELWKWQEEQSYLTMEAPDANISVLRFTPDGKQLMALGVNRSEPKNYGLWQWNIQTGECRAVLPLSDELARPKVVGTLSPDTSLLALSSNGTSVQIRNTANGKLVRELDISRQDEG